MVNVMACSPNTNHTRISDLLGDGAIALEYLAVANVSMLRRAQKGANYAERLTTLKGVRRHGEPATR